MKKRILSLFLTILMLCTLLPISSVADGAIAAQLGSQTVSITCGQSTKLSFTPEEDSWYLIYTTGNYDTFVDIEWVENDELYCITDDNSGNSMNFRIIRDLTAGIEYSILVEFPIDPDEELMEKCDIIPVDYGETINTTLVIEKYEATTSGKCGDNATWHIVDGKNLTISGTGPMWDFDINVLPWKDYNHTIESVVIEDGVTSIGYGAFSDCENLTNLTIGNDVQIIGEDSFYCCLALKRVKIPDSVQSIGTDAFHLCTSLTELTIGKSVETIGDGAFSECWYLTGAAIPDSVKIIGNSAFCNCEKLVSLTIGKNVQKIGNNAFSSCRMKSVTIPDGVKSIGDYAFAYCTNADVTISDSVESIGECALNYCQSISVSPNNQFYQVKNGVLFSKDEVTSSNLVSSSKKNHTEKCGFSLFYYVFYALFSLNCSRYLFSLFFACEQKTAKTYIKKRVLGTVMGTVRVQ